MKYDAILFDLDGIIVDTLSAHQQAFRELLLELKLEIRDEDFVRFFVGKTDEAGLASYAASAGVEIDIPSLVARKSERYLDIIGISPKPYPGLVELIQDLSYKAPLGLVSNSLRVEADHMLKQLGIDDCFDIIVSADSVNEGKPSPEGYLQAIAFLGKEADGCVAIESSVDGVIAAKSAGISCIAVTNIHDPSQLDLADRIVERVDHSLF